LASVCGKDIFHAEFPNCHPWSIITLCFSAIPVTETIVRPWIPCDPEGEITLRIVTKEITMFANTLTITIDGTANVLTRVNQDNYGSEYVKKDATQSMILRFRNSSESSSGSSPEPVDRHNMFFEHVVYATATTSEKYYTMTATMRLRKTSDPAWLDKLATGFITLLSAQKTGLVGGES